MANFNWDVKSDLFNVNEIVNKVNADKLFVSLLIEIEKRGISFYKNFSLLEIADLIPRGTAGVTNYATYGFSIMSMLSAQKDRDYFVFKNKSLTDELTRICNNNVNRDNYAWKKHYANELVSINSKYLVKVNTEKAKAGDNEKQFIEDFSEIYGKNTLKGKKVFKDNKRGVEISVDNSIEYENKRIFIEIDSGNMAKLIVGQYVLLNELCDSKENVLFLVIHMYKDKNGKLYNSERTIANLEFINETIYKGNGLKFKILNKTEFEKLCHENRRINSFISKLYEKQA